MLYLCRRLLDHSQSAPRIGLGQSAWVGSFMAIGGGNHAGKKCPGKFFEKSPNPLLASLPVPVKLAAAFLRNPSVQHINSSHHATIP